VRYCGDGAGGSSSAHRSLEPASLSEPAVDRRAGRERSATGDFPISRICRTRRAHGLWARPCRRHPPHRRPNRKDPERRQPGRHTLLPADEILSGHQSEDRESARYRDIGIARRPRRRGDRVRRGDSGCGPQAKSTLTAARSAVERNPDEALRLRGRRF
jgi:hypothetical protein